MEKFKLLPSQVEYMEREIQILEAKRELIKLSKKEDGDFRATSVSLDGGVSDIIYDSNSTTNDAIEARTLSRLENIRKYYEIVDNYVEGVVGIGSSVTVLYAGEKEEETFTIVDIVLDSRNFQVESSVNSDFGKSVLGKKVGEGFCFKAPCGQVCGIITNVENVLSIKKQKTLSKAIGR